MEPKFGNQNWTRIVVRLANTRDGEQKKESKLSWTILGICFSNGSRQKSWSPGIVVCEAHSASRLKHQFLHSLLIWIQHASWRRSKNTRTIGLRWGNDYVASMLLRLTGLVGWCLECQSFKFWFRIDFTSYKWHWSFPWLNKKMLVICESKKSFLKLIVERKIPHLKGLSHLTHLQQNLYLTIIGSHVHRINGLLFSKDEGIQEWTLPESLIVWILDLLNGKDAAKSICLATQWRSAGKVDSISSKVFKLYAEFILCFKINTFLFLFLHTILTYFSTSINCGSSGSFSECFLL